MPMMGYLPSPHDPRDFVFEGLFSANPGTAAVLLPTRPPLDQGPTPECVTHAAVRMVTTIADLQGVPVPELSPHFLYQQCLLVSAGGDWDIIKNFDAGTYPRTAMKRLSSVGIPSAELCPLPGPGEPRDERPTVAALLEAHERRAVAGLYVRCLGADDISAALHIGHPVMIGLDVGAEWYDPPALLDRPSKRVGGHAILVVGQDDGGDFIILNSWGDGWHAPGLPAGHARLRRSYVDSSNDSWTMKLAFQ